MATRGAKAIRAHKAQHRLDLALGRLAKQLDVEESAPAPDTVVLRDPELRAIRDTERLADRVEALDAALHGTHASEGAVDLFAMKRADLNAYAADLGIVDAESLPNKDAVIAAIEHLDAETAPDAPDGPPAGDIGEQD